MGIERIFMDWKQPALHSVVDLLEKRHLSGSNWDMTSVLVVVPGYQSQRRLQELLALRTAELSTNGANVLLIPPVFSHLDRIHDLLIPLDQAVAGSLDSLFARTKAILSLPEDEQYTLFPNASRKKEIVEWIRVADQIQRLQTELSDNCVSYSKIQKVCEDLKLTYSIKRWKLFETIQNNYLEILEKVGLQDAENLLTKTDTISANSSTLQCIYLLCLLEIPKNVKRLLLQCTPQLTALIHAPIDHDKGFDAYGCLEENYWATQTVPLNQNDIAIVNGPLEQALEVVNLVSNLNVVSGNESVTNVNEYISVAVCDDELAGPIERSLELAGYPAMRTCIAGIEQTPPARVLKRICEYTSNRSPEAFASLLRHPDIEQWLIAQVHDVQQQSAESRGGWVQSLVDELDTYLRETLPAAMVESSHNLPPTLQACIQQIEYLLKDILDQTYRPSQWAEHLQALLSKIYGQVRFRDDDPDRPSTVCALKEIGRHLREWTIGGQSNDDAFQLVFAEAVDLLMLRMACSKVPDMEIEGAIHLNEWKDAALDDMPVLIITGFNEGFLPDNRCTDPFLPDTIRHKLGLGCNHRCLAKDTYLLISAVHSHPCIKLVSGKTSADNSPLSPSRLLFACDSKTVVERVLSFYDESEQTPVPLLLVHGKESAYANIPLPAPQGKVIDTLSVTAFKQYLACPYRFYLRYVEKLKTVDDGLVEMGQDQFGELSHLVLRQFTEDVIQSEEGRSTQPAAQLAQRILKFLHDEFLRQYGHNPVPAVQLQMTRLECRLRAFAERQFTEFNEGWRFIWGEQQLSCTLDVDGKPFTLMGRVDRLDQNLRTGQYRILDYKTSRNAKEPDKTHRKKINGITDWVDLQLPLYRLLVPESKHSPNTLLGYFQIPADVYKTGISLANWTEDQLVGADNLAVSIIRKLRQGDFWPPSDEVTRYSDGFERICLDNYPERGKVIHKLLDAMKSTREEVPGV